MGEAEHGQAAVGFNDLLRAGVRQSAIADENAKPASGGILLGLRLDADTCTGIANQATRVMIPRVDADREDPGVRNDPRCVDCRSQHRRRRGVLVSGGSVAVVDATPDSAVTRRCRADSPFVGRI
jgi:hypothetical protein